MVQGAIVHASDILSMIIDRIWLFARSLEHVQAVRLRVWPQAMDRLHLVLTRGMLWQLGANPSHSRACWPKSRVCRNLWGSRLVLVRSKRALKNQRHEFDVSQPKIRVSTWYSSMFKRCKQTWHDCLCKVPRQVPNNLPCSLQQDDFTGWNYGVTRQIWNLLGQYRRVNWNSWWGRAHHCVKQDWGTV